MRRIMNFLTGLMIGGLIGSTVGMLLAPYSGMEFREQIQARARQIQKEMEGAASARRAELEEQLATLRAPRKPGQE